MVNIDWMVCGENIRCSLLQKAAVDFYKAELDMIDFSSEWQDNVTMCAKLKVQFSGVNIWC